MVKLKLKEMKKNIFKITLTLITLCLMSFTVSYVINNKTAEVRSVQGINIYAFCTPVVEYNHLGVVKGPKIGSHEFDKLVNQIIKKVKKEFPEAEGIVFDSGIKQTHNTSVSVIKFK